MTSVSALTLNLPLANTSPAALLRVAICAVTCFTSAFEASERLRAVVAMPVPMGLVSTSTSPTLPPALVNRTRLALAGAIDQLDDSVFFLDVPFRAYGKLFLRLTASVSRAQELSADALSAKTAGATAARTALRLVHERSPLWQTYLHLDVLPFLQRGLRVPVLEGYRSLPDEPGLREQFSKLVEEQRHHEASPWDTHPTLEQRLAALPQGEGRLSASPPALRLLGEVEQEQESMVLETSFTGEVKDLHPLSWNELGTWLAAQFEKTLEGTVLAQHTALEDLPGLVTRAESLSEQLGSGVRFMSREARRRDAAGWLVQWLTVRLVAKGFDSRWQPGAGLRLVRGEETLSAQSLVDALESGELHRAGVGRALRRLVAFAPRYTRREVRRILIGDYEQVIRGSGCTRRWWGTTRAGPCR